MFSLKPLVECRSVSPAVFRGLSRWEGFASSGSAQITSRGTRVDGGFWSFMRVQGSLDHKGLHIIDFGAEHHAGGLFPGSA